MLFQPAGDGAHEVLAAGCLAFPVVGFAAGGGVVGVEVVGGFLEDDFGHGCQSWWMIWVWGWEW